MIKKGAIPIPILLLVASMPTFARELTLATLISLLQEQGFSIVYSNSQINPHRKVEVKEVSLDSLRHVLSDLGLELKPSDTVWLVGKTTQPSTVPLREKSNESTPPEALLETVIVTGSMHRFPSMGTASSAHSFDGSEMALMPSVASDAMRVSLRLPGVSSVGISAKPRIRGGLQDELLFIQDGVELMEPFHLADYHSAFSSIDYHTIESMDVYTGGFPSRYGNRMSGVLDIQNKWQEDEYDTNLGVSTFSNTMNTRGEFGREKPTTWIFSVRNGDLTDLANYIETRSGDPKYFDTTARMNVAWSEDVDLSFGGAYAQDDIVFKGEDERASSNIETGYLWVGWNQRVATQVRSKFTASVLDFRRRKTLQSAELEAKGGALDHRQEIVRFALRNDWTAARSKTLYEFGWQAHYSEGRYKHLSGIDRGVLADILDTQRLIESTLSLSPSGWSGGAYTQAEWAITTKLRLQPSLRWDFQDYYLEQNTRHQWSPRLGVAFTVDDVTELRFSAGRFYQPEGIQELQVIDDVTRFFKPQYSDQVVLGLQQNWGAVDGLAEVYYKAYRDLKGRFENIFNPFVLLPEMEPDRVAISPERADVIGLDLTLNGRWSESLTGNMRYSYMDAREKIDGTWVDRRWSQGNTVSANVLWEKGNLSLSAVATWHSGWRTTRLPQFVPLGTVIPIESVLNNNSLRNYYSLDLSARYSWNLGQKQLQAFIDISNATDRQNQAGIDFDVEETSEGFMLTPDREALLGRVTSVGLTLSF